MHVLNHMTLTLGILHHFPQYLQFPLSSEANFSLAEGRKKKPNNLFVHFFPMFWISPTSLHSCHQRQEGQAAPPHLLTQGAGLPSDFPPVNRVAWSREGKGREKGGRGGLKGIDGGAGRQPTTAAASLPQGATPSSFPPSVFAFISSRWF